MYDEMSWARLTAFIAVLWVSLLIMLIVMGQWGASLCWVVSWLFGFASSTYTSRARNEIL